MMDARQNNMSVHKWKTVFQKTKNVQQGSRHRDLKRSRYYGGKASMANVAKDQLPASEAMRMPDANDSAVIMYGKNADAMI